MCSTLDSGGGQVNPLAETTDGTLVAADAKLGFDDNAAFRQPKIFAMRDTSQEDPRCASPPSASSAGPLMSAGRRP